MEQKTMVVHYQTCYKN